MAPKRGLSIERTEEYDGFISKLSAYHEKRGTNLDLEPKVGIRHIDLSRLYERVVEEGGYDLVSDTKAKPLMWRKLAEEFVGKNQYTTAQAFQIKNVYYKNLVAYEITNHWNKEPPPKEILEDVTAKGGNVMTRTLENFARPLSREQEHMQNGDASDASPEQKTPKEEKAELAEDPGSGTGRSTRGLRQQPPQRVLFQPDVHAGRQARVVSQTTQASPTPGSGVNGIMNASSLTTGTSSTLASYEPSQVYPLSLRPVTTPANNPEYYKNERKRKLEASAGPLAKKYKNIMLPGTGFIGPNIYVRAQLALQSGVPDEEQYALHHLVKISHERGDKYRFDQFPGLADALIKKVLQVTSLFYDVEWDVTYDDETFPPDEETLNGLHAASDIHQRLASRISLLSDDTILDAEYISQLNRITESGLIIRNMCLQEENALYLARMPLVQDLLAVVLNLPRHSCIIELQHYALDTAEQVLKHIDVGTQDALFQGLVAHTFGSDRGAIAASFRTISRIAMNLPLPKRLDDIPLTILRRAQMYLLVEDEELCSACLDLLSQYTSFSDNVEHLLMGLDPVALAQQLSRLVLFTAKEVREPRKSIQKPPEETVAAVPRLSKSVVEGLLKLDEPERSSEWLRMCFLADLNAEMTQISLWQAYQGTFAPHQATHPHLIAGDFIKNVSTTFQGATAQVAGSNKYVIRGIRARKVPVDTGMLAGSKGTDKGKELHRCCWKTNVPIDGSRDPVTGLYSAPTTREGECAEWFRSSNDILRHVLQTHLGLTLLPPASGASDGDKMDVDTNLDGAPANNLTNGVAGHAKVPSFDFAAADERVLSCRWAGCTRTSSGSSENTSSRTLLFARHIATHLPETDPSKCRNVGKDTAIAPINGETVKLSMLEDEKGDATGVPLRAAIVLRNIARFMPKTVKPANGTTRGSHKTENSTDLMSTVFTSEVQDRLFYALSYSKTMRDYIGSIFRAIRRGDGKPPV